jgi:hypothetical protein
MFVEPVRRREPQQTERECYRAVRSGGGRGVVLRPAAPIVSLTSVLEPSGRVDWGRESPEACHLAWLLLFDASGSTVLADDWCDSFSEEVVERLPRDGFVLARDEITSWLDSSP